MLEGTNMAIRRDVLARMGGFDPAFQYAVDWEFWIRLARSYPVAWIERPTVGVRWHPASETHRFRTGTVDLQEQEALTGRLLEELGQAGDARVDRLRGFRDIRLARAYLNRAYTAACDGRRRLELHCLCQVGRLRPAELARTLVRPRLVGRLVLGPWGRSPATRGD
jgi:hypothetical protein